MLFHHNNRDPNYDTSKEEKLTFELKVQVAKKIVLETNILAYKHQTNFILALWTAN